VDVIRVVAVLAELGDVDAVGVLQVAVLGRLAGLPLVRPRNLEMILQGAVFYSLAKAADAGVPDGLLNVVTGRGAGMRDAGQLDPS